MNLGKENETIEFKKSTGELKEAMISISAMLNKHGFGVLYFGVKPNGDVIGQEVSDSSLRDVSRAVYEMINPQIYPVIDEVVIENKHLIKVEFSGAKVPYSAMGRYYLRTADEDREVSPEELKEFFWLISIEGRGRRKSRWLQLIKLIRSRYNLFGVMPFLLVGFLRVNILLRLF